MNIVEVGSFGLDVLVLFLLLPQTGAMVTRSLKALKLKYSLVFSTTWLTVIQHL